MAQITKGSGTVTEYMPGLVDKALFLKTPYALVTGHRERKLRNLEVPSSLAGLHSVERCLHATTPVSAFWQNIGTTIMDTTKAFWLNLRLA